MNALDLDWAEAERLWRSSGGLEDRLALVERALAALGGNRMKTDFGMPGQDRDLGRTK
ncbi:MAG TPA: hypothetical protein VMS43_06075 [Allosphingosinicella sp.]|nr:hypothetical protein [Allosphingosinicella sp.]